MKLRIGHELFIEILKPELSGAGSDLILALQVRGAVCWSFFSGFGVFLSLNRRSWPQLKVKSSLQSAWSVLSQLTSSKMVDQVVDKTFQSWNLHPDSQKSTSSSGVQRPKSRLDLMGPRKVD